MNPKKHLGDLAVFGGSPAFSNPLHVGRPNVGDRKRLLARIHDLLDQRQLTNNGPYVQELERKIAELLQVRHCIATCNGTVAIELAAKTAGLSGEVIVPSFTFIATAHALRWIGLTPVFCDIDPQTYTIDPDSVEAAITSNTSGILAVHLFGRSCDIDRLQSIADQHGLKLLFDAAHAFSCSYRGQRIGGFGLAEVFSFHATKFFNTFEGGAVTTNDDTFAERIRRMRNFGFVGYDRVESLGINGKMSEIAAAMGLTQLEDLGATLEQNEKNANIYREGLAGIPGIRVLPQEEGSNHQYTVLELDASRSSFRRDQLMDLLWAENIRARRYFYPGCHQMQPYSSDPRSTFMELPVTERIAQRVLCLPSGAELAPDQIRLVCSIIRFAAAHSRELSQALQRSARSDQIGERSNLGI